MRIGVAMLALGLAGCGPKAEDVAPLRADHCPVEGCKDGGSSGDGGPVGIPPEPLEPWDETGAGALTGIFAVETVIKARVVIPVETRQIFRLRILQHGKTLQQKTTLCAFKLPVVEDVATLSIPAALQALMQKKHVENQGEFLDSENTLGAGYHPPESLLVVGAKLADPANDDLPSLEEPATAFDEDQDGNPGVTLDAQVVTCGDEFKQLYVALRTKVQLDGRVITQDAIEGKADVDLDQSTVGFNDDCLTTAAGINILIEPGSPMHALRVGSAEDEDDNGNVSCPEIALNASQLFGEFWE